MRLLLLCVCLCYQTCDAAVGLVTIPQRESVRMTIYNSVDLTLIQETRTLVLKKGINHIQYQWAGTLIDTTSLELRPLVKTPDIEIIDVVYPPNSPATLVWEVDSKVEGPLRFEISYFTSGLGWGADYSLRANEQESAADLEGWVAVENHSGEDYPQAEVHLVVGTINLIERIRDLATGQESQRSHRVGRNELRRSRQLMMAPAPCAAAAALALPDAAAQIEVLSARLADYHIFSISGTQSVMNGATSRFLAISNKQPMDLEVLYRVTSDGDDVLKLYRLVNDAKHNLPDGPLPEGQWHVFRIADAATNVLSFSGSVGHDYVPPGQKVELELGADPGIAIKQVHEAMVQSDPHYDQKGHLDGWIEQNRWRFKLVNTKPIAVSLEYLIHAQGDWSIDALTGERRSAVEWRHQEHVASGQVLELGPFTVMTRIGARAEGGSAPVPPKAQAPTTLPAIRAE
jgi:hypothetical protein